MVVCVLMCMLIVCRLYDEYIVCVRLVVLCLTDYMIDRCACAGYDSVDSEMPELELDSSGEDLPLQMDLTFKEVQQTDRFDVADNYCEGRHEIF